MATIKEMNNHMRKLIKTIFSIFSPNEKELKNIKITNSYIMQILSYKEIFKGLKLNTLKIKNALSEKLREGNLTNQVITIAILNNNF